MCVWGKNNKERRAGEEAGDTDGRRRLVAASLTGKRPRAWIRDWASSSHACSLEEAIGARCRGSSGTAFFVTRPFVEDDRERCRLLYAAPPKSEADENKNKKAIRVWSIASSGAADESVVMNVFFQPFEFRKTLGACGS